MTFSKQGPKRRRHTRRELPEGGFSQWANCWTHFRREREAARSRIELKESLENWGICPSGRLSRSR